jgi:hypothetical protein
MIDLDDDALASALALEHDIDTDLRDPKKSILLALLASARTAAIAATRQLIDAPPFDPNAIMRLQNDVRRFQSLHVWLRNKQSAAAEAFNLLPPEEQEAVRAYTHPNSEINDA